MIGIVREHLASGKSSLEKVTFVLYDQAAYDAFEAALNRPDDTAA